MDQSRESRLNTTFVRLADSLTTDFDLVDLLQTLVDACAELLDASAGGLMLADRAGRLHVMVSTSDAADVVELAQLSASAGPCMDCFATGQPVTIGDIDESGDRWPGFREAALAGGFRSVHATPMRLRDQTLGSMNLFSTRIGALNEPDIQVAQALTDVATIGILQERSIRDSGVVQDQLQRALSSRIVIEQAKGALAQRHSIAVDGAFQALRAYARSTNQSLHAVALAVVELRLDVPPVAVPRGDRAPRPHGSAVRPPR